MLNTSVVNFYNNFDLMFRGSEDVATKGVENSFDHATVNDASSREKPRSEWPHKPYISGNWNLV